MQKDMSNVELKSVVDAVGLGEVFDEISSTASLGDDCDELDDDFSAVGAGIMQKLDCHRSGRNGKGNGKSKAKGKGKQKCEIKHGGSEGGGFDHVSTKELLQIAEKRFGSDVVGKLLLHMPALREGSVD
ncbi:unnamed protein product [Prorocentrum cordatum]|uniref:Uncharacterized protein n=1 Tax=Prorocentrum cordatum TaxID=2364126 RepID=A0ABN9RSC5_9DINO|nr:unnamed protein product [Polarella glacialis]